MNSKKIGKVLIANRGEIAVRIIKTLRKLHISSVTVFADNDADALYRRMSDEACPLGSGSLKDTYLNIQKIIDAALDVGADAIHPGYGFLAESPAFAEACVANNLIFIGPDAETMRLLGNKIAARQFAIANGIPVTFGISGTIKEILNQSDALPYPVLIKAAAGGGGKGMHIVRKKEDLQAQLEQASREAANYFGDGTVFVEQYIENPRHIEVQVLADHYGHVIHLFERECTIQRRYQKIIEESPSPSLTEEKRQQLFDTAIKICKAIGYKNAGTIEFIFDEDMNFYFLEVNTRIQVEHPVTEQLTGIDIVEEQIRIARGKEMGYQQENIVANGHAMELRIYAENPENGFLPTPGTITAYHEPQSRGVRIDSSIDSPSVISDAYDPMIAKLICYGKNRQTVLDIVQKALNSYIIQGIVTNKAYLWEIIKDEDFINNRISNSYCAQKQDVLMEAMRESRKALNLNDVIASFLLYDFFKKRFQATTENVWEEIGYWRFHMNLLVEVEGEKIPVLIKETKGNLIKGQIDNKDFEVEYLQYNGNQLKMMLNGRTEIAYCSEDGSNHTLVNFHGLNFSCSRSDQLSENFDCAQLDHRPDQMRLVSPMPGRVMKINVMPGDVVDCGCVMMVVEAMKMENNITATCHARVEKVNVTENQRVDNNMQLIELKEI